MKNKKVYLLFSLFLLILNVRIVKAVVTPPEFHKDEVEIIASTTAYGDDLVCESGTKFKVYTNSLGDYVAEYIGSATEGTDEEEISCTSSETGNFKVKLKVNLSPAEPSKVSLHFNPSKTTDNLKDHIPGFKKLGEEIKGTGNEAVTASCHEGDSDCLFTAKSTTKSLYYLFETYYYDINDKKVNLTVNIQVEPGKIYIDFAGTCKNLNGWTKNAGSKYEAIYTTSLKLPSGCEASNNPFKEFTGWRAVTKSNVSSCNEAKPEYEPGKTFAFPENTVNLQSCYVDKGGFRLSYSKGTISNTGKWKQDAKNPKAYYITGASSATLPNVTPNEGEEFVGWKNSATGEIIKAGGTVGLDSTNPNKIISLVAWYKTETSSGGTQNITGTSNQMVRVGKSAILVKGFDDDKVCNASTKNYKLWVDGNDCMVTGIEASDKVFEFDLDTENKHYGIKLIVLTEDTGYIHTANDNTITNVVDNKPPTITNKYTVDTTKTYYVNKTNKARALNGMYYSKMKELTKNDTVIDKVIADNEGKDHLYPVDVHIFQSYESTDLSKQLLTICLDPGREAPTSTSSNKTDWVKYKAKELNLGDPLDAGLYAIAAKVAADQESNPSDVNLYAADFAARIWILNNNKGASVVYDGGSSKWPANYSIYRALADKTGTGDSIPWSANTTTDFWSDYTHITHDISVANFQKKMDTYYQEAKKSKTIDYKTADMKISVAKEEESSVVIDKNRIKYVQAGTLTLPDGSSAPEITPACTQSGYDCNSVLPTLTRLSDNKYRYRVEIYITPSAPAPDKSKLKFKIQYDNNKALGTGFVLFSEDKPDYYQRMLVLAEGEQSYELEVYPNVNIGYCDETVTQIPQYDYNLHCGEGKTASECASAIERGDFNAVMFNKMGCCESSKIVDNPNSIAYKYICGGEFTCNDDGTCERKNCTSGSIAEACLNDGSDDKYTDVYQINEGVDDDGNEDFSCIVELKYAEEYENQKATESIIDTNHNQITVKSLMNTSETGESNANDYCRVSCKEDWYFTSPSYKNFTGEFSIPVGGVLKISSPVFISSKKTCVTTTIDIEGFKDDVKKYAEEMWIAANNYEYAQGFYEQAINGTIPDQIRLTDEDNISFNVADYEKREDYVNTVIAYTKDKLEKNRKIIQEDEKKVLAAKKMMYDCQHLQFKMTEDNDGVYKAVKEAKDSSISANLLGEGITPNGTVIEASFNPNVTFAYEDYAHNEQMNGKNEWIPDIYANIESNSTYFTNEGSKGNPIKDITYDDTEPQPIVINNPSADEDDYLYATRNNVKTSYYLSKKSSGKEAYSQTAMTESELAAALADPLDIQYLYYSGDLDNFGKINYQILNEENVYLPYHYVKTSVENSSFFTNKYGWFETPETHTLHEIRKKNEALNNFIEKDGKLYSLIGGRQAYPISFDARRGFYQYAFTYNNIGQYSDGSTGRILGGQDPLLDNHNNPERNNVVACFYEVYEAICGCCGEPIKTEAAYSNGTIIEGAVDTQNYLDGGYTSDYGASIPIESVNNKNKDNTDSKSSYKYQNYNTGGNKQNGTLRLVTTPVSLSDVSGFYNADDSVNTDNIAANWAEDNDYTVGNTRFETDKGAELLGAIRENGEIIYDKDPEYSFNLTPQSISAIKTYNLNKGYGIQDETLETKGLYVRNIGGYNDPDDGGDASIGGSFTHYGSKFLSSEMMKSYIKKKPGNDLCYVATGEVGKIYSDSNYSSTKCRWVDYYNTDDGTMLAFK